LAFSVTPVKTGIQPRAYAIRPYKKFLDSGSARPLELFNELIRDILHSAWRARDACLGACCPSLAPRIATAINFN
jgi:hypothetical protein